MSPSANETGGGLEAPKPIPGQTSAGEFTPAAPEQAPVTGQNAPTTRPSAPLTPSVTLPLPPMPLAIAPQGDVSTTTHNPVSAVIDDGDLIEKEWVNKAKQIVERNRDDPYKQSEELTVFKADYLKKHYDKSIKLNQ
jgi:hypothetical protein